MNRTGEPIIVAGANHRVAWLAGGNIVSRSADSHMTRIVGDAPLVAPDRAMPVAAFRHVWPVDVRMPDRVKRAETRTAARRVNRGRASKFMQAHSQIDEPLEAATREVFAPSEGTCKSAGPQDSPYVPSSRRSRPGD